MSDNDEYYEEIRELNRRADCYVRQGLHPGYAKNKARKDMREGKPETVKK